MKPELRVLSSAEAKRSGVKAVMEEVAAMPFQSVVVIGVTEDNVQHIAHEATFAEIAIMHRRLGMWLDEQLAAKWGLK